MSFDSPASSAQTGSEAAAPNPADRIPLPPPAATGPAATGPAPTPPAATGPAATGPAPTRPAATGPAWSPDGVRQEVPNGAPRVETATGPLNGYDDHDLTPDGVPRLVRRRDVSIVGGVAAGIADHLRVPVLAVRVAFALMAVIAGAGVLAYALLWIFVPPGRTGLTDRTGSTGRTGSADGPTKSGTAAERRQAVGIAALGLAVMIAATALGVGQVLGWVLGPLGLAALGGAFIWREADDVRRARWRKTAAGIVGPSRGTAWRVGGGVALVVGGLSVFAIGQLDFTAVRSALIAVLLTLVGVAVITVPWWVRLVRDLGNERQGRMRERERAEIAAHLHDSVLQTLTLIKNKSDQPREVLRLARRQERELRTWLYGPAGYAAADGSAATSDLTFAAALAEAAGDVEDIYAIEVAPVVVGDTAMDPHLAALVAAAREAMVNAAKHSGVLEVSVYAEIEDGTASVFVRDRGTGFDVSAVDPDRRGLAESIRGRMERHGGKAVVRSTPGEGTEVELQIPITISAAAEGSA
ncbi:signal transduction histidine kinase/phage shock protein PspC (stress-responsive transcriptional regulator) [Nakamurella sp. UYEF19]|uniref:ATP-binding protein n=1 Tax=Nakamurella sp. UYEF19 TaxID=1756392 RepID=UPI0033972B79